MEGALADGEWRAKPRRRSFIAQTQQFRSRSEVSASTKPWANSDSLSNFVSQLADSRR